MRQPHSCTLKMDSHQVSVIWTPGLGLTLRVLGTSYYETRPHRTFPQDAGGDVSALDVRRAQEEMLLKARRALR